MAEGYCRRSRECAAARQTALYNRVRGAKPLCLACGGPLRKRAGRFHTECHTHPRRILLARLAAGIAALEARREAERKRAPLKGAAAAHQLHASERWLAETRAGLPCPVCRREIGANGLCWTSKACADTGLELLGWNPAALYQSVA
jgi:hypothetical protein